MKIFCAIFVLCFFSGLALAQEPTPVHHSNFTLPDGFVGDLTATFGFGLVGIVLLVVGFKIFDKLTPQCNFLEEIAKGNIASAIVSASLIFGLAYIMGKIASAIIGQ